ncbi:MAG: diadenylate cyclase CdaA [Treponemataceae bacterium]|nr:MAG: diadenylate cyclase CdaA [Treponemataceae bacterium]
MIAIENLLKFYDSARPVIDVLALAFVFYKAYEIVVRTNGMQIIRAIIVVVMAYVIAFVLNLTTALWILNTFATGILICFAIVFQPELRKIFLKIGQTSWFSMSNRPKHSYIESVLLAAEMLSSQKRGMLAVFVRQTGLKDIMDTGTYLNADLTSSLLVTIFGHDTPLHDGAAVIQGGKVVAAGCFLPLSEQHDIKKTFGTRHRASLGISEETDALVLVVSEESGAISLAYDSKLHYDLSMAELTKTLEAQLDMAKASIQSQGGDTDA